MTDENRWIGIDVSRAQLDGVVWPSGGGWRFENNESGIRLTVKRILEERPMLVVLEATGRLAKTDRLDAEILARFAEAVKPTPMPVGGAVAGCFKTGGSVHARMGELA